MAEFLKDRGCEGKGLGSRESGVGKRAEVDVPGASEIGRCENAIPKQADAHFSPALKLRALSRVSRSRGREWCVVRDEWKDNVPSAPEAPLPPCLPCLLSPASCLLSPS